MSLGSRIKVLRKSLNLTQKQIADKLGMGNSNFGHIENDRVTPTSKDLDTLAEILGTSTDYLLGREEQIQAPSWATENDIFDLKRLLEADGEVLFDGAPISKEDKLKAKEFLTVLFWESKKKQNK
ncbi:helix-turn-helix domain-containing protein [Paenibacillus sp. Leaf72]|uniref:helix-turn-helix domain-containing protein n=1 Tax=Paenibacillus sp. Leaf72 TaxID=1736234 RepID=UPI0006F80D04|nr:helix-turn-helix transcriptional regulator [Paenibacillus sp. Leaf72]KQO04626.1 hypothetical protein ASF12_13945 [Paenibacillus sp. Leaf72]